MPSDAIPARSHSGAAHGPAAFPAAVHALLARVPALRPDPNLSSRRPARPAHSVPSVQAWEDDIAANTRAAVLHRSHKFHRWRSGRRLHPDRRPRPPRLPDARSVSPSMPSPLAPSEHGSPASPAEAEAEYEGRMAAVVAAHSLGQQLILAAWDIASGLPVLWSAIGWPPPVPPSSTVTRRRPPHPSHEPSSD